MVLRLLVLPLVAVTLLAMPAVAQEPPPQAPGRKPRVSPPQPQQAQGLDYFIGAWTFTWIGRESPVTAGPREGTLTYVREGAGAMALRAEGRIDSGAAFTETGSAEWNADTKTMTWVERLSTGVALRSIGDWSSPIGIRAESEPVKAGSQTIRVRRLYSILVGAVLQGHRRDLGERRAVSAARRRPLPEKIVPNYRLAQPKFMPKGSTLLVKAHYDNSKNNPFNPDPAATVRWGDQTWEEMLIGYYGTIEVPGPKK